MTVEKTVRNTRGQVNAENEPIPSNYFIAIILMFLATICTAAMHTAVSYVSDTVHPFVVVFFRLLFALIVVVPFFIRDGLAPLKTNRLGMLAFRGVLNICAITMFFHALSSAPLADITALSFTAPLFATLLAAVFIRERLGWRRSLAVFGGFLGTLIVLRPSFNEIQLGYALVLVSSFIWGGCVVIIKELSRTESSVTITTYMSLVMAPLASLPAIYVWQTPSPLEFMLLIIMGVLGGLGQMLMSQALKLAETHVVMPLDYLRLIWVSLSGLVIFGQVPTIFVWMGGSLIFTTTAYIAIRGHRRQVEKQNSINLGSNQNQNNVTLN